jgi:hypothetical protein
VQPGDFEFAVTADVPVTLAGIGVNVNFQFGYLGSDIYARGASTISLPVGGSTVTLQGTFCASNGTLGFALGASLDARTIAGFGLASGTVTFSDGAACLGDFHGPTGLYVNASFDPQPFFDANGKSVTLQANVYGNITQDSNGVWDFGFGGNATLNVFGVPFSAGFNWNSSTGASLPLDGLQDFGSGINFSGSATVASDGSVCGLSGSVTLIGITGTASFCDTGGSPALTVSLAQGDLKISGTVDGPTWSVTGQAAGSLSIDDELNIGGTLWGVDSTAAYDVNLTVTLGQNGLSVIPTDLSGNGDMSAVLGSQTIASAAATLSGQPPDVCGTVYLGGPLGTTIGSAEVCDDDGTVEIESLSVFGLSPPNPPFPSLPWTT